MFSTFKAARLLGWASIGVAISEIVATGWLEEILGVQNRGPLLKSYGLREVAAGITILNQVGMTSTLVGGLWSRVAGDAVDLATLGLMAKESNRPRGLAAVTGIVVAVTAADLVVASVAHAHLSRAEKISSESKARVTPTDAVPTGTDHRVPAAAAFIR